MWKKVLLFLAFTAVVKAEAGKFKIDPFMDLPIKDKKTTADRVREHDYPSESHYIETEDGYILNLFRIPYSPKLNNKHAVKPVVFLQHGLFSCSDCFILNGPEDGLAYNLVDAGFDVWMGNARGNIYSRENSKISLNHPNFWAFGWHEIGMYDIPAMIDFILKKTGESTLHYVGHSQGTTAFFVMASMLPEYNKKIRTAHMLAPAVFMGNSSDGMLTALSKYVGEPGLFTSMLDNQQFLPYNAVIQKVLDSACGEGSTFPKYCEMLFLMWGGSKQPNFNQSILPLLAETHPAGISTNQGIHYIQLSVSNLFRQYDHGPKKNLKQYKQDYPPEYPLHQITANMYIYYGLSDTSSAPQDVQRLPQHLHNIQLFYEVPDPKWAHLDFIFANQVKEEINDLVIEYALEFESNSKK